LLGFCHTSLTIANTQAIKIILVINFFILFI
jgi:hypothetical protein